MIVKNFTILVGVVMFASQAFAQAFYETLPARQMYSPVQREDGQLFNLNPAVVSTTGSKVGGYLFRRERSSTLTLADTAATTTKTDLLENGYGGGAIFDLGAGAAAGVTAEKLFSEASITADGSRNKLAELMVTQTLTGRVLIDLAQGLRVGLALRFMNERGDILGSTNSRDRIKYDGSLVGHGGGIQYANEQFAVGAAYFPAARGKTEIISEERIITEPGIALIDFRLTSNKNVFALGIDRSVQRRDERAVSVTAESGQGSVALDGISPDKNTFAKQSIRGGLDWMFTNTIAGRLGLAQHQREWIFDGTAVPGDSGSPDAYTFLEWQAALHLVMPVDVVAGLNFDSYEKTLSGRGSSARTGAKYKAGGRTLFVTVGTKL